LNWIQTYTGKRFNPADPCPEDIDIEDIAIALSRESRYNGHYSNRNCEFFSVAQHLVLVSQVVSSKNALWAVSHDFAEAYIKDIPKPLKELLPDYQKIEKLCEKIIFEKFGLIGEIPAEVKEADVRMLYTERRDLFNEQLKWSKDIKPYDFKITEFWSPFEARKKFLKRFNELYNK